MKFSDWVFVLEGILLAAFFWITPIIMSSSVWKSTLVKSGRCEYQLDAKTGNVRLVWSDTKQPVEGESR